MKAQTLKRVRRVHHYIGVFFTPAILLFALSGALQTFRLHEEKGYGGAPPSWIVWLASVHKDSSTPRDRGGHDAHRPIATHAGDIRPIAKPLPTPPARSRLPMQVFVLLLSIGLIVSSLLGVVVAINNSATRRTSLIALGAGTVLPLLLMLG